MASAAPAAASSVEMSASAVEMSAVPEMSFSSGFLNDVGSILIFWVQCPKNGRNIIGKLLSNYFEQLLFSKHQSFSR